MYLDAHHFATHPRQLLLRRVNGQSTDAVRQLCVLLVLVNCIRHQTSRYKNQTFFFTKITRARADRAVWHLSGGPVGLPAWWAATSNVAGRSGMEEGVLPWIKYLQGPPSS